MGLLSNVYRSNYFSIRLKLGLSLYILTLTKLVTKLDVHMDTQLNRKIQLIRTSIQQPLHKLKGLLYLLFSQIQADQSLYFLS